MDVHYEPTVFTRHKKHLHALILERQAWFCLRDLGYFLGMYFEDRVARKLAPDQRRHIRMRYYGEIKEVLVVNESAAYALLIYHGNSTHDSLRKWLTYQVLPMLRDQTAPAFHNAALPALLKWQRGSLSVIQWQDEPWIRVRDMPCLLRVHRHENWWTAIKCLLTKH